MTAAPDVLTLRASEQPDKPALIDDRADGRVEQWSFAELEADANRLANAMRDHGIQRGHKVVWCGQNSPGLVRMMHAARKIGATAVPLNYRLTPDEAAYVVDNCDAELVYTDAEFAPLFREILPEIPKVQDVWVFEGEVPAGMHAVEPLLAAASDAPPRASEEDAPAATMIYTSGTTGKPKGALRRGSGDPELTRRLVEHIGYESNDVYLTTGPLYHSGPGGFMAIAHALGNTVILQRKFAAEDWLRLIEKYRVTTTFSAPTPVRLVCNLSESAMQRYDRSSMKRLIANAAPWSHALKLAYLDAFPDDSLFEVYGSTELGVNTILRPEDQCRKPGSCGQPAPGVELALFGDDGERIEVPHVPGELFARSRSVFSEYYKAEEKYEADRRGDFHTVGDVAYFDEEGFYYICDRKKDMIISGGMNIYPAEIEASLDQHPDVQDIAVFGIPSEDWGESVHAVVVARVGSGLTEEGLVGFAREHLAGYKIPRSVAFIDDIPRTGSGKILKRVLRAPFWEGRGSGVA